MNKIGSQKLQLQQKTIATKGLAHRRFDMYNTTGGGKESIKATSIKSGCSRTTMSRETHFVLQQWPERKKDFGSIGVEW